MPPAAPAARAPWYRTVPGMVGMGSVVAAAAALVVVLIATGGDDGDPSAGGATESSAAGTTLPEPSSTTAVTAAPTTEAPTTTTTTTTTTTVPSPGFDASQAAQFTDACEVAGFSGSECTCWIDELAAAGLSGEQMDLILNSEDALPVDLEALLTGALDGCWEGTTAEDGYSEEFRAEFMSTCRDGDNRLFCRCSLTAFEEIYGEQELTDILEGNAPVPAGFSDPAFGCLDRLPTTTPIPKFVQPNTCLVPEWSMVVSYRSGWVADQDCTRYYPEGWDASGYVPVTLRVDVDYPIGEYYAEFGEPEQIGLADRDLLVWTWITESGEDVTTFLIPLWPEVPDGPLVAASAWSLGYNNWDLAREVAEGIVRGIEIEPYSP